MAFGLSPCYLSRGSPKGHFCRVFHFPMLSLHSWPIGRIPKNSETLPERGLAGFRYEPIGWRFHLRPSNEELQLPPPNCKQDCRSSLFACLHPVPCLLVASPSPVSCRCRRRSEFFRRSRNTSCPHSQPCAQRHGHSGQPLQS